MPIFAPGNVNAKIMMNDINMNSNGTRILEALPIPLWTFLFEMDHSKNQAIKTPIVVGIKNKKALDKSELPPTLRKYVTVSVPQLNVKLLNR